LKLYIIAGEASGDLHGSNLIHALRANHASLTIRAWGGDRMQQQGATIVKHYRELAFMGFYEVLLNIRTILRNIRFCKEDVLEFKPDALILIDYPGFNLRIAKWAHENQIPVLYYIAPQVWAWKENRIHAMKKHIKHLFVVLPFEKQYFEERDMPVTFVGHPLLGSSISYAIAKRLVKIKYISLVNLILDRHAVTELIQHELNVDRLSAELNQLLHNDQRRESMKRNYSELRTVLGGPGASDRTATAMLKIIESLPKQPSDTE